MHPSMGALPPHSWLKIGVGNESGRGNDASAAGVAPGARPGVGSVVQVVCDCQFFPAVC